MLLLNEFPFCTGPNVPCMGAMSEEVAGDGDVVSPLDLWRAKTKLMRQRQ